MELLSIENLKFRYPKSENWVINDLSLSISKGEFVVLSGPTGCGKTTLFKLIKKELSPMGEETGKILFFGKDKKDLSAQESAEGIGFVMQDPENQIVTEKVLRELSFYMENLGYAPAVIAARVGELSNYFGITPWIGRDTFHLSGGQKQLLTLASVMTVFPDLLILDEPTSRLDPIAAGEFITTLKRINTELGVTVLLCEHRLEEVLPIADKFFYMENGAISHSGDPRSVCLSLAENGKTDILPAATRIWHGAGKRGEAPLSVKEGKAYLDRYFTRKVALCPSVKTGKEVLVINNVWFRYEKEEADVLRGADLTVYQNEILTLVGGNGSGKSTVIKLLAGIKKPYRGKITLYGKNLRKLRREELYNNNISYLPQDPTLLFARDTVGDELGEEGRRFAEEKGLKYLLASHPHDLSGGEMQKCALIKLLTARPKILLLDEPTKGLDAEAKKDLISLLKELKKTITVVIVTHDVEFAAAVSDRCALLFGGEVLPPAHPQAFFSENYFYTTSASRIARGMIEGAVSVEQIVSKYDAES